MPIDTSRAVVLIVFLLFIFLSPNSRAPTPSQQRELETNIQEEWQALNVINTSTYGGLDAVNNRWVNLTGLRQEDGYAWDLLPKVKDRAKEQLEILLRGSILVKKRLNMSEMPSDPGKLDDHSQDALQTAFSAMNPFEGPPPVYQNVTSIIRGRWGRSKIAESEHAPFLNLTNLAPGVGYISKKYNRNITGLSGDLRIKLDEKTSQELKAEPDVVREITAEMMLKDESSSGDGWEITMFGVHYPQQGGIMLSTTSEKFQGIFALPHFAFSTHTFALAQQLLNQTLVSTIEEQESSFNGPFNPWTSSPGNPSDSIFPTPHCEFIMYLQQHPIEDSSVDLKAIEHELRFFEGAPIGGSPAIKMSALIFSPDCGFVLESKGPPDYAPQEGLHLNGQKLEAFISRSRYCVLFFMSFICGQIYLLKRQMNDASTPSTRSRISFYTIAMMALADGFLCMGFMIVSMFIEALSITLVAAAFLLFLCVSFFGMKFLMDIWTVQAPERQERERQRQREQDRRNATANQLSASTAINIPPAPEPSSPVDRTATPTGLPLPATARRWADNNNGPTPVILPPDQDLGASEAEDNNAAQPPAANNFISARREMGALYSKFYFLLVAILFLSLYATGWPTPLRSLYSNALAFFYFSCWVPQVYRNIMRNCRKALRWEFVMGESILRLAPFIYFYIFQDNVLFIDTDQNMLYVLASWLWIQIWALISQEILGPRFFVPSGWAPPAYDYHPILHEDADPSSAAAMPIGFTEALVASSAGPSSPTSPTVDRSPTFNRSPTIKRPSGNRKVFDCSICTDDIEIPFVPAGGEESGGMAATMVFERRRYMVTPCRHVFHSACLEGWMRYRLQCPICRENLPPL